MKIIGTLLACNIIFVVLLTVAGHAQTLSPVRIECGKRCSGQFTVSNGSIEAMNVIIQPFSSALTAEGKSTMRPIDNGVDLRMPEMSARIAPHDAHTFDYSLKCVSLPCMVSVLVNMSAGHTADGMQLRVIVPETIYACEKAHDCRKRTFVAAGVQ